MCCPPLRLKFYHRIKLFNAFLVACAIDSFSTEAQVIDFFVQVQPIQVRSDDGFSIVSEMAFWEAETDKIWKQAGIDVQFLSPITFDETDALNIGGSGEWTFSNLRFFSPKNPDTNVINLWFIKDIEGKYGEALINANGIVIDDQGITRRDSVAHELGHNLGLNHISSGEGGANNLMLEVPIAPGGVDDIYPDGADLSFLNASQIAQARQSDFLTVVPEPSHISVVAAGGLVAWSVYRKRRARQEAIRPRA